MIFKAKRRVLYLQFAPPGSLPPLHNSARQLMTRGWEVTFLGVGALGVGQLTLEGLPPSRLIQLPAPQRGWKARTRYAHFVATAVAWAVRWQPSHLYVSDSLACPAALVVHALTRTPLLYHEHDSPDQLVKTTWLRLCCIARRAVARRALCCVLPNQDRALLFDAATGAKKTAVVWNCPSHNEVPPETPAPSAEGLRLYYHGTLNPHYFPEAILHAVALTPTSVTLSVIGPETVGSLGYRTHLAALSRRLGIERRVLLGEPIPRARLFAQAQRCDVGLVLMPRTPPNLNFRYMVGASNKAFDYLACGLPLIVSDLPEWHTAFVEGGYALACHPGRPAAIAAAIRWYLEHLEERAHMGRRGRERILRDWNYERQFAPVLHALENDVLRRQSISRRRLVRPSGRKDTA